MIRRVTKVLYWLDDDNWVEFQKPWTKSHYWSEPFPSIYWSKNRIIRGYGTSEVSSLYVFNIRELKNLLAKRVEVKWVEEVSRHV